MLILPTISYGVAPKNSEGKIIKPAFHGERFLAKALRRPMKTRPKSQANKLNYGYDH